MTVRGGLIASVGYSGQNVLAAAGSRTLLDAARTRAGRSLIADCGTRGQLGGPPLCSIGLPGDRSGV